MNNCERCYKESVAFMMSFFNTQMCCMECIDEEKTRQGYAEAKEMELEQVRNGNYSFEGVGLPDR